MPTQYLLLLLVLISTRLVAHSSEFKKFQSTIRTEEPSSDTTIRLSNPLIRNDGRISACSGKNLFAFETNATIAWIIPLNYLCSMDIAPVGDESGKIYLVAEDRVLKIKPSNIGTSESVVEVFFGPNSTLGGAGGIIGLSISISYSTLFVNVKKRGLFAIMLHGQLLWSAGPMLYRFGYRQGCKKNLADCYFISAPVVDQCEGTLYISNTEGQLYSLYIRSPHFRWIQDFSSLDKLLTITPGNNGRLYIVFPRKALVMALDVSSGNVLWQQNVGPLSAENCLPVVDSNGWLSIGSLDGFLYALSPTGVLKTFLKATAPDSVVSVSPVLDCSGFAIYISQTMMEAKSSRTIGDYTYVSAMKPLNIVFTLLVPATGTVYWTGKFPDELSSLLSNSNLRYFALDERTLLAILASASIGNTLPCYTARQKLAWTCSQAKPKFNSIYTGNEKAISLFLLFQFVIIVLLAVLVRFCCIFWRKKKLQDHDLGKFLEKRRSLHSKRKAFNKMISELEEKAVEEAMANEVLEQLGDIVRAKKGIERKLSTTYSLGRDRTGSQTGSILPLYDGKTKSYSFHGAKQESVTIFNTLSDTSTSGERRNSSSISSDNNSNSSSSSSSRGENWQSCGDTESAVKGKAVVESAPSSRVIISEGKYGEGPSNPLFSVQNIDKLGRGKEELMMKPMQQGRNRRRMWLKRRTLSSTN